MVKHQVTTAPVRGTADAHDPDVQKKTLAGHGIVIARAGSTARVGRPVELTQVQHTEGIIDDRAVIQQPTPAIRTVQETAEVPRRQQLGRGVEVAVPIQLPYSNEVRAGSLEVQVQKGSSDIMKIVIMETTNERPGADVDDGFATTESELAVHSGEAAERETLAGNGIVMARAGSTAK